MEHDALPRLFTSDVVRADFGIDAAQSGPVNAMAKRCHQPIQRIAQSFILRMNDHFSWPNPAS